jgi:hypothetical protein
MLALGCAESCELPLSRSLGLRLTPQPWK